MTINLEHRLQSTELMKCHFHVSLDFVKGQKQMIKIISFSVKYFFCVLHMLYALNNSSNSVQSNDLWTLHNIYLQVVSNFSKWFFF